MAQFFILVVYPTFRTGGYCTKKSVMAADFAEELALQASVFRAQDEERFKWMNVSI